MPGLRGGKLMSFTHKIVGKILGDRKSKNDFSPVGFIRGECEKCGSEKVKVHIDKKESSYESECPDCKKHHKGDL
jgi:hypothetical protein